ncbi:hypothetical protein RhiirC2_780484 [Rhizophagus irregularis]|uniref:Uncharacterized protein n=1 Tax=Rhizophagus irregularis TaxID=588596 RepID=A0A2N1N7F7_9GLOM|nr:hypothetical protein RhiirC2_780484 [Rhizophagus irregularis]
MGSMGATIINTLFMLHAFIQTIHGLKKGQSDYCYFRRKVEPFNDETFEQFGDDDFKFWSFVEVRRNRLMRKELQQNKAQFINSGHWERELNEWEEMLIEQGVALMEEEEVLRENSNSNLKDRSEFSESTMIGMTDGVSDALNSLITSIKEYATPETVLEDVIILGSGIEYNDTR